MCFGPVASFTASAFLSGVGTVAVKHSRSKKELLFAAFPFLFAAQQFIEGIIWLLLKDAKHETLIHALSAVYLFFAYSLWPVLCPYSIYNIEPDPKRKKILKALTILGAFISVYLFYHTLFQPRITSVLGCSIRYRTFIPNALWFLGAYGVATIAPYFTSTHRAVLIFGLPNLVLCVIAYMVYQSQFVSVWCFFAALISANLLLFLRHLHESPVPHEPLKVVA